MISLKAEGKCPSDRDAPDHEVPGSTASRGGNQLMTVRTSLHRAFHYHPSIVLIGLKLLYST